MKRDLKISNDDRLKNPTNIPNSRDTPGSSSSKVRTDHQTNTAIGNEERHTVKIVSQMVSTPSMKLSAVEISERAS